MFLGIVILSLLVIATLGWGTIACRALVQIDLFTEARFPTIGEVGLLGLLAIAVVALVLHFAVPLGGPVPWIIVGVGCLAALVHWRILIPAQKPMAGACLALLAAMIVVFAIYVPDIPINYDSGLYHLQTFMWMHDEPIVFGLAQLHGRFGFNTIWFGVGAISWLSGFGLRGIFLMESLPVIFVLLGLGQHMITTRRWRALPLSTGFAGMALGMLLLRGNYFLLTSTTSSDNIIAVLTLLCAYLFLRTIDRSCFDTDAGAKDRQTDLTSLTLLCLLTVMTKLILLPLLLLPAGIIAASYLRTLPPLPLIRLFLVVALISTPWVLRSIVLTGCLVYPVELTCFHELPWTVRPIDIEADATHLRMHPRFYSNAPILYRIYADNFGWVPAWFDTIWNDRVPRLNKIVKAIVILTAIAVFVRALEFFRRPPLREETNSRARATAWIALLWVLFTMLASIGLWFVMGPQSRYILGPVLAFSVLPATMIIWPAVADLSIPRGGRAVVLGVLGLLAVYFVTKLDLNWRPWQPEQSALSPSVKRHVTIDGTAIFEPLYDQRCYMAPKPCAPGVNPYLEFDRFGPYLVIHDKAPEDFVIPRI